VNNNAKSDSYFTQISKMSTPYPLATYKLIFVGDVMLGRTVMTTSIEAGDFSYPFLNVSERLNEADFTFANLENPIISECPIHTTGFKFCALPEMLDGLLLSGIDMVSLANNHSRNYGAQGVNETKKYLLEKGISYVDTNEPNIRKLDNLTVGLVAFDFTVNMPENDDFMEIYRSSQTVDFLIASIHWGVEYTKSPTTNQRKWAMQMVESGADLIIGHHPHWVQTYECLGADDWTSGEIAIDQKSTFQIPIHARPCVPVYYSLGNFVFDQMWSEETRKGSTLILTINEKGEIVNQEVSNTYMQNWAQPIWVE